MESIADSGRRPPRQHACSETLYPKKSVPSSSKRVNPPPSATCCACLACSSCAKERAPRNRAAAASRTSERSFSSRADIAGLRREKNERT
eukprot:scaffold8641_cov134-Isochrysis_galbana.AAC.3